MNQWAMLKNGHIVNVVTTNWTKTEVQQEHPDYQIEDLYSLPSDVQQRYININTGTTGPDMTEPDYRQLADSWQKLRTQARVPGSSVARGQLYIWLDANSDDIIALLRDAARALDDRASSTEANE